MARNPAKDQVAFVGVGSTGFARSTEGRSRDSFAVEAAKSAILDAGLTKNDIDGIVASGPSSPYMATALGIPALTHYTSQPAPFVFSVVDAMNAVFSGSADYVLLHHAVYRAPAISASAAKDPFRRGLGFGGSVPAAPSRVDPENVDGGVGYAAWASRYRYEYGVGRQGFARVAVNDRSNAANNPLAALREPMTMDDYYAARMVRDPLCLFDMDVPVDGADAFVVTTAERARDLPHSPVLIHAATTGLIDRSQEDQIPGLNRHGQHVVVESLRAKSDIWIPDIDVYFPYDGFTIITLSWIENTGWCGPGEATDFLEQHWDADTNRIMINGRIPLNPHGGALSEGGTQGSGHVREAIVQLRGDAAGRQVAGAKTAFLTPGGFFFNAQGLVLRAD
jgi:acetyl-CoA acetyltransferase